MITVFTPTYNRAHTLQRLFESLCRQTSCNFEWVIVDDGSTDNTETMISSFIETNLIEINYCKQKNGGKHRAINKGVSLAKGEFFFIVDSDDFLTNDAIELIEENTKPIRDNSRYCGIVGLKCNEKLGVIGDKHSELDTDFLSYRVKHKVRGDRAEIIKTAVMKEYPFPEFEGESFCTEAVVWNRISRKYIARYLNMRIYICEYLEGGLTSSIRKLLRNNPRGMALYYKELSVMNIPLLLKIKSVINFKRYTLLDKLKRL